MIIDPFVARYLPAGDENPFRDMPRAYYRALFWGVITEHLSVPRADSAEGIVACIRELSVPLGQTLGRQSAELYDAYTLCGGPDQDLPYWEMPEVADEYIQRYLIRG